MAKKTGKKVGHAKHCYDERHGAPCPLPCDACFDHCPRAAWEDSELNRRRDKEWAVRAPKGE